MSVLYIWSMHANYLQSCLTLCEPMDYSLTASSVHWILQARILEWVAMCSSRGSSWPGIKPLSLMSPALADEFFTTSASWEAPFGLWSESESEVAQSCPTLCDPWTVACQAPLSMGFSRQEYWSGLPFPSPGDLPNPGVEPGSPALQAGSLPSEPPGKPNCSTSMEYYRAFKGNELSSKKKHRGNLDIITGKKASWKAILCVISTIWHSRKIKTMEQ